MGGGGLTGRAAKLRVDVLSIECRNRHGAVLATSATWENAQCQGLVYRSTDQSVLSTTNKRLCDPFIIVVAMHGSCVQCTCNAENRVTGFSMHYLICCAPDHNMLGIRERRPVSPMTCSK
jgi:hypothetical protein